MKKKSKKTVKKSATKKVAKKTKKTPAKKPVVKKTKKVKHDTVPTVPVVPVVSASGIVTMTPVPDDIIN